MNESLIHRLYIVKIKCEECRFIKKLWIANRFETMKCPKCSNGIIQRELESDDPVYTSFYNDIAEVFNPNSFEDVVAVCDDFYDLYIDIPTLEQILYRCKSFSGERRSHEIVNEIKNSARPLSAYDFHNKKFKEDMVRHIHNKDELIAFIKDISPRVNTDKLSYYINNLEFPLKLEDISMMEIIMIKECYDFDTLKPT